jgi:hypothetical protein
MSPQAKEEYFEVLYKRHKEACRKEKPNSRQRRADVNFLTYSSNATKMTLPSIAP